jgi:hypothetical protein
MRGKSRAGSRAKRVADDEMPDSACVLRGREGAFFKGSGVMNELTFAL